MDVLVALASRPGEMVGRDELIAAVWKHPHVTDEALSRCISMLRHALGDDRGQPRYVETIPKRGYRLVAPLEAGPRAQTGGPSTRSVAVLPFIDLTGAAGGQRLADGMTELLISRLSCVPGLNVISRTSSMHYKGTQARLTDIARELGVTNVVEGSVLRSGKALQVVGQVIDTVTDTHVLARTHTCVIANMLRQQNEIARSLAEEIAAALQGTLDVGLLR
jgi:TolB-like protein